MKSSIVLTIVALLAILSLCSAFDYFMFVQRWPGGVCATSRCNSGAKRFNYWVIHGLWPQNNDGTWPSNCGAKFNAKNITDLIPQLESVWPDLERNDEKGFWAHEFDKHGSCSTSTYIQNEHDYFSTSIKLQSQISLANMLNQGGVTPGGSYSSSQIFQAVQSVTGASPQLHCIGKKLVELRVCVDKNLRYTNCDQHEANCGSTIDLPLAPH
jgi:ribonuclease T2